MVQCLIITSVVVVLLAPIEIRLYRRVSMRNGQTLLIGKFILLAAIYLVHSIVNHILHLPSILVLTVQSYLEHGATAQSHTIVHELVQLTTRAHHIDDIVQGVVGATLGLSEVDKQFLLLKLVDEHDAIEGCRCSVLADVVAYVKCGDGADVGDVLNAIALHNLQ